MKTEHIDIHRQTVKCPTCGQWTAMRQIEDWGTCEACRARDEEEEERKP
jgi:hypothetical protein